MGNIYTIGADQTANNTTYRFAMGGSNGSWFTNTTNVSGGGGVLAAAGGDRFQLPRIAAQNSGRIILSYYDTLDNTNNQLRFHFGTFQNLGAAQIVANNAAGSHQGSIFTSVGFLSTGRPVIAWYDRTNMNLVLSYGNTPTIGTVTHNVTATQTVQTNNVNNIIRGGRGRSIADAANNQDLAAGIRTFQVANAADFTLGEQVTLTWNGVSYENLFVIWRGNGTTANNGNCIALKDGNLTWTTTNSYWSPPGLTGDASAAPTGTMTITRSTLSNTATGTGTWQGNAQIVNRLAGSHVDMVIDQSDRIHLAYYDVLSGGLFYSLVPTVGGVPNLATATTVKVDTYLSAGTRIMLNVRREGGRDVPYISYFHASFDETKNSIRVAWQHTPTITAGSDDNDRLTGHWEVMTVPTNAVPASGQIIASGAPSTGTVSGTPTDSLNQDVTRSMIVGYLTNINYEGARLKHNIHTAW